MLALDDAGCAHLNGAIALCGNGTLAVNGLAQCVDNTPDQTAAHGYRDHLAGALDGIAFLDSVVGTQDNDGNGVFFQVLCHAIGAVGEFHQLACHALIQAGSLGNAVTDQDDHTGLAGFQFIFVVLDLTTDDFCNFFGS